MNNIFTIKEVYDQCRENDWLGSPNAYVLFIDSARIKGFGKSIVAGFSDGEGFSDGYVIILDNELTLYSVPSDTKVDWIGNKPKTKKLHACIRTMKTEDGVIQYLAFEDKEWFQDAMQWLPEDKYPPFEIEEK